MEMPIGEFLDRYSIVKLKYTYLGDEIKEEHQTYLEEFLKLLKKHPEWHLLDYLEQLHSVNRKIWGLESNLRKGNDREYDTTQIELCCYTKEDLLQLAAVGQAAINIRNANRDRVKIRNEIAEKTGTGFTSPKIDHASEEITDASSS